MTLFVWPCFQVIRLRCGMLTTSSLTHGHMWRGAGASTAVIIHYPNIPNKYSAEIISVNIPGKCITHLQLSFSVIGFRFYRFCRFYRITRELKKSKMLPPLGSEPRQLWLSSPACYPSANSLISWKSQPLDSYVVMLYWFLDLEIFWDQ